MPELPEVETIRRELVPWVVGQRFVGVDVLDLTLLGAVSAEEFSRALLDRRVESLERRGKYLIFHLGGKALVMHFRMTGALLLNPEQNERYVRAVFHLSSGARLAFVDRRRLGVAWMEGADALSLKLGPEPLDDAFTAAVLMNSLKAHHIPIKAALLDQTVVAGIGNMYADEALFAAGIHPLRMADSLSDTEAQVLFESVRRVLLTAIGSKGASVDTYIRPSGQRGNAQSCFKVAHRRGEPCPTCGTIIERVPVRSRGTCFCPRCQQC